MKHHNVVAHVPSFQLSTRSSSFFCAFFLHFYEAIFFGTPNILLSYLAPSPCVIMIQFSICKSIFKTNSTSFPERKRKIESFKYGDFKIRSNKSRICLEKTGNGFIQSLYFMVHTKLLVRTQHLARKNPTTYVTPR